MGLFNLPKRDNSKSKGGNKIPFDKTSMYSGFDVFGQEYILQGVQEIERFNHSGRITVGLMATIVRSSRHDAMLLYDGDFISFELSQNVTDNNALFQRLIEEYGKACRNENRGTNQTYLGEFKEVAPGEFAVVDRSDFVENYMDNIALERIERRASFVAKRQAMNAEYSAERDFDDRIKTIKNADKRIALRKKEKLEKCAHPTFEKQSMPGSQFEEYKGVNIITGDDLLLVRCIKHGADLQQGTYFYTAFLSKGSCIQFLNDGLPKGKPIAFATDFRLQDIADYGDANLIGKISSLLSCNTEELPDSELTYIGKLDRAGEIKRDVRFCPEPIKKELQVQKEAYRDALEQRRDYRTY